MPGAPQAEPPNPTRRPLFKIIGSSSGSTKAELPNLSGSGEWRKGEEVDVPFVFSSPSPNTLELADTDPDTPLMADDREVAEIGVGNEDEGPGNVAEDGGGRVPMGAIGRVIAPNGGPPGGRIPTGSNDARRACPGVMGAPGENPGLVIPIRLFGPGPII